MNDRIPEPLLMSWLRVWGCLLVLIAGTGLLVLVAKLVLGFFIHGLGLGTFGTVLASGVIITGVASLVFAICLRDDS